VHFCQIECKGKVTNNIAKQSFRDKMTFKNEKRKRPGHKRGREGIKLKPQGRGAMSLIKGSKLACLIYLADYEKSLPEDEDFEPGGKWASMDICERGPRHRRGR